MLSLTPRLHPTVASFLSSAARVHAILDAFGSPVNLVFPNLIKDNLSAFEAVYRKHDLCGRIYYAHKSNKSISFLRELAMGGAGVDTASEAELVKALAAGIRPERIEATGPKSLEFLWLCIQHGVLLNVDSLAELELAAKLSRRMGGGRRDILLRLCGFEARHSRIIPKDSRFGIALRDFEYACKLISAAANGLALRGLAFHLDTTSSQEKLEAAAQCLELMQSACAYGLNPRVLNVGGGFGVNYLAERREWDEYITALRASLLGQHEPLTWNQHGFGLRPEQGVIRGSLNIYEYYNPQAASFHLDALLGSTLEGQGRTLAQTLQDCMLELYIEPGHALLDQCGVTLARVGFVKQSAFGEVLVGVEMKRSDLVFENREVFVDPLLISQNALEQNGGEVGVYLVGNLCLESDLIFKRKVFMRQLPSPGDALAFINTAAYMSDFSAAASIQQRIASKVAVVQKGAEFRWFGDEQYSPIRDELCRSQGAGSDLQAHQ